MIDDLLGRVADLDLIWLAVVAFFLPFSETVMFFDLLVPGEVGLIFVGAAADTPQRLVVVFVVGAIGAFTGDSVSWFIGHRWGTAVLSRWPRLWRHAEPGLKRASGHFEKHGGKTVFFARFVGALRAVAPMVAGAAGLRYRAFAPWNAAASVVWVGLIVTLGAWIGDDIVATLDRFGKALSILVVVLGVAWVLRRRLRHRPERA